MTQRIRHRLTYANIMSTVAVFAALGGGAYAAATIGPDDIQRNAVRSKHIKKNQVGRKHLKRKAVSTAGRVTLIEARIVFTDAGECLFNATATEIAT